MVFLFSSNIKTMTANWWRFSLILNQKKLSHLWLTEVIPINRLFVYSLSTNIICSCMGIYYSSIKNSISTVAGQFKLGEFEIHHFCWCNTRIWHIFRRGMNIFRFLPFHFSYSIELCSLPKKRPIKKRCYCEWQHNPFDILSQQMHFMRWIS